MADFGTFRRQRDRRLRRRLLETLYNARAFAPSGWYGARSLVDLVNTGATAGAGIEDEMHALALLRDLEAKGLIEVLDQRTRKLQAYGLTHLSARITSGGASLIEETAPVDLDIEDERIG